MKRSGSFNARYAHDERVLPTHGANMGRRQPCRKRRRLQVSSSRLELEVPTGGEVDDGEKEESIRKNVQAGGLKQLDSSHL